MIISWGRINFYFPKVSSFPKIPFLKLSFRISWHKRRKFSSRIIQPKYFLELERVSYPLMVLFCCAEVKHSGKSQLSDKEFGMVVPWISKGAPLRFYLHQQLHKNRMREIRQNECSQMFPTEHYLPPVHWYAKSPFDPRNISH